MKNNSFTDTTEEMGLGMKKALLVTRVSGFIPQHEMNNVKILQEMGYEVHYATNLNMVVYGKDNSRLEGTGIITHQIDFQKSPFSKSVGIAFHQLKELMLQEQFDLVHCHMPLSAVVTRLVAQQIRKQTRKEIPVLYTAHGLHFYTGAPLKNWLYYPIERYLARYTDRFLLINQEDFQRGQRFPVRGKVEYVPGVGIPLEGYQPAKLSREPVDCEKVTFENRIHAEESVVTELERDRAEIEHLIGRELSPTTKVLVDIGELSQRKNHCLLVEMMEDLKDLDLICVIAGTGEEEPSLKHLVREKGLEHKVFLPGYVSDVKRILAEADCFVFPSYQEGLPVAVMEAMAAGLPIVASKIRGVTDLIEHGQGGYLVQGFDPVDYAVKVRRLFTEKYGKSAVPRNVRRYQMGQWNQERIKLFSREVVDQKMREIYDSLEETNDAK